MQSAARSIVAVLIGLTVIFVMKIYLTPMLLRATGIRGGHSTAPVLFFVVYAIFIFAVATLGGFITGSLAKVRPIEHAAALVGLTCIVTFITYHRSPGGPPSWYEWMIGIVPPFCILTGAAFYNPKSNGSERPVD